MKKIILIISALFVVGVLGGVTATFLRPKASAKTLDKSAEKEKEGKTVELEEFVVNLADTEDPHFLKTTLALEVEEKPNIEEEIKSKTPQIRDAVITTISRDHFDDLLTPEGKKALKNGIRHQINELLGDETVKQVYLTAFAMQ